MLLKNTLIKMKKSFGRYISLFMIVMIGTGFYAGIQATAPDMIALADHYYKAHNLLDFKIISSMGLTDDDVNALKALNTADTVIPSYSLDALDQDKAIRIHAIEDTINTVTLLQGRMPQRANECIADSRTYKIGDQIKITDDTVSKLKNKVFTVVGTADSVLYLSKDYGSTTIGDGKLSSFIFIGRSTFNLEAYTEIYLSASGTSKTDAYSKKYDEAALRLNDALIKIKPEIENARQQEIYEKSAGEISKNETKLRNEKAKGEKELSSAKAELDSNAKKLQAGKVELDKSDADLQKNIQKQGRSFADAEEQISAGWKEINSELTKNGIKRDALGAKINELDSAISTMKNQMDLLPAGSVEYEQLSAGLKQSTQAHAGLLKLQGSIQTLTTNEAALAQGKAAYNSEIKKAADKIIKAKNEMAGNEKKLNDGYEKYYKNLDNFNTEMAAAEQKLDDARGDLSKMEKPQWYIWGRDAAVGYSELKSSIDVVSSVAKVFPFFFILIGMLMTSNSMARMIAEERSELGTLTSLGYQDNHIISTYLFYVLSASVLGVLAGFFGGCRIIPPLIYQNFQFVIPPLALRYDVMTLFIITVITLTLMLLVTMISCNRELRQKPAVLMRPVPPQKGQMILLEKIKPVWKSLSFTWKVTLRNMFRYKKRAFMTIVGVAGCTSFLLVGFGLRDSMNGVAEKQYGDIFRYGNMIILKDEITTLNQDLKNLLAKEKIENPLLIRQTAFTCKSSDKSLDLFLIVPENENAFSRYYSLKSKSDGHQLSPDDNGVIITQKLSEAFKVNKGDTLTIKDADSNAYELSVTGVAENYTANYIYMNNSMYRNIFGKAVSYNAVVSNHTGNVKALAEHLIDSGLVFNVVFTSDLLQKILDNNKSLNSIIVLLVVVASLLAIIVLYNLTSINISERKREIATLKVLGFSDGETNGYIYREALILTFISIGAGLILGIFLHRFVVQVIEGTSLVFFKKIGLLSFMWACLLTIVFSVIMQIVTYFKLRTIDMIESLKSVE